MKLFSWGTNSSGQCGLGFSSELVPVPKYTALPKPTDSEELFICGGGNHTIILDAASHSIYGSGLNSSQQLSLKLPPSNLFIPFPDTSFAQSISAVACGWDFSLFLSNHGVLYGCGSNKYKQITHLCNNEVQVQHFIEMVNPLLTGRVVHFAAGLRNSAAINEKGQLYIFGDDKHVKNMDFQDLGRLVKVSCGQQHIVVLNDEGILKSWGSNRWGQCGQNSEKLKVVTQPAPIEWDPSFGKIVDIVSGWSHSLVLTDQKTVYSWGRNTYGQLGRPSLYDYHIPTRIEGLENITSIAAGSEHSMALSESGQLFTFGWNEHGSCGNGDTVNQLRPVNISHQFPTRVLSIGCGAGHCFAVTE